MAFVFSYLLMNYVLFALLSYASTFIVLVLLNGLVVGIFLIAIVIPE